MTKAVAGKCLCYHCRFSCKEKDGMKTDGCSWLSGRIYSSNGADNGKTLPQPVDVYSSANLAPNIELSYGEEPRMRCSLKVTAEKLKNDTGWVPNVRFLDGIKKIVATVREYHD